MPVLSTFVLRSAWIEQDKIVMATMWQPLLIFLKGSSDLVSSLLCDTSSVSEFPRVWELDAATDFDYEDVEPEDSDDDDDEMPSNIKASPSHGLRPSHAYTEFLQFLKTGCSGAPLAGYPTVIVILSTIPSSVCVYPSNSYLSHQFSRSSRLRIPCPP